MGLDMMLDPAPSIFGIGKDIGKSSDVGICTPLGIVPSVSGLYMGMTLKTTQSVTAMGLD